MWLLMVDININLMGHNQSIICSCNTSVEWPAKALTGLLDTIQGTHFHLYSPSWYSFRWFFFFLKVCLVSNCFHLPHKNIGSPEFSCFYLLDNVTLSDLGTLSRHLPCWTAVSQRSNWLWLCLAFGPTGWASPVYWWLVVVLVAEVECFCSLTSDV